jgi:hypothetical protein
MSQTLGQAVVPGREARPKRHVSGGATKVVYCPRVEDLLKSIGAAVAVVASLVAVVVAVEQFTRAPV